MNADQGLTQILHHLAERNRQGGPPADQHIVVARAQCRGLGSRRKPDDFAQTAPPTCRETVKPIRIAAASSPARCLACSTNARPEARSPSAAARKSLRRLSRSTVAEW